MRHHRYTSPTPMPRLALGSVSLALLLAFAALLSVPHLALAAGNITVDRTDDTAAASACTAAANDCSLRGAFVFANTNAGATITINAGTYTLSLGELQLGTTANHTTSIVGAGAGTTIIQQTTANRRVININPTATIANIAVTISGVTITGGSTPSDGDGGAGIIAGGPGSSLNLSNCILSNNSLGAGTILRGAGVKYLGGGVLTINNCQFSNNTAVNVGGAVDYTLSNNAGPQGQGGLSITNSTFSNNTAGASGTGAGGAIRVAITTTQAVSAFTISNNTFTGNAASAGFGGAIDDAGSVSSTMRFNRFFNNTASSGSGIYKVVGTTGSIDATENWWGCNTGPGTTGCDTIGGQTANITVAPRLFLTHTASPNTIVVNQASTLTASFLTDSAGGAVTVANISRLIGVPISFGGAVRGAISGAQATIQANGTATATFTGNAVGAGSATATVDNGTATVNSTINKANTTTTITADTPDPSVAGQAVTISYSVVGSSGNSPTAPIGNVTVSDGVDSCLGTAVSGQCVITLTTAGARTLTATYPGDANFNPSTSAGIPHTVTSPATTTTITADNPDPSVVGQAVTINYSVTTTGGTPTGNVTVSDGTQSCTGTVAAGLCSLTFTSAGAKTLTATYPGDANFTSSTSAGVAHTVNKANTTTTITSDTPDPSITGQIVNVQYNLTVNAPGSGTPSGNVTISDGTDSCVATIANGQCAITLTTPGARTLTATYPGDANFNPSASAGIPHTVTSPATTTTITADNPDPSVVGQAVTINYSVTTTGGTPTGNVTVSDGTQSCTGTVAAGLCSLTFTSAGAKTLTATYPGDANFTSSTSAGVAHTVNKADTTTTITSDTPDPSTTGEIVNVQYNLTVNAPGSGTPSGNVTISDGTDSCVATIANGQCAITLTTPGARTLTATYPGDTNFNPSTSAGAPHTVGAPSAPDLTIAKSHTGNFTQGQTGAQYTISVSNGGTGPSSGTVTMVDTLPTGLTATAISGTSWNCMLGTLICTRTDPLAAGASYPNIILTVDVASNAAASVTNNATVSGGGDSDTGNNSANDLTVITAPVNTDTTTTITADTPDPSVVGQAVTVQYSVTPNAGSGTPTGNVTVSDGPIFCTATVAAGQCNLTFTSAGAKTLTATYVGGGSFNGSVSAGVPHTVNKADTTTTIISDSPDPSLVNQSVTVQYQVAVNAPGAGTPTGNLTVSDGTVSCTATVAAGQCNLTFTSAGPKTLTATYSGDADFNGSASAGEPHTVNTPATPDLTITKSHSGSFTQGQTGAQYTMSVTNIGTAASSGTVTVADNLPSGLTATAFSGTGWSCTLATLSCTRSDALASGNSYPNITLTVNVASNAPASVTNSATVSGGNDSNTGNNNATDPTTVGAQQTIFLAIIKTHSGNFTQGQTGAQYTIAVKNNGTAPSSGTVTVADNLPSGLTATAFSGTGWSCTLATWTCTRSDALASGGSYPNLTLTVNVASNATSSLTNTATVAGGGDQNTNDNTATDPTTITPTTTSGSAQLVTDPCDASKTALLVTGTANKDKIEIVSSSGGKVKVILNKATLGPFSPTGTIIVLGLNGDDSISVSSDVKQPRLLYGGDGKDKLNTNNGVGILIGGSGDDTLENEDGRSILIGGPGIDKLEGGNDDDVLIAGTTSYDDPTTANQASLCAIQKEWLRTDLRYQLRIDHLLGTTAGGLNGVALLKPGQTVFDDTSKDKLEGDDDNDWFLLNRIAPGTLDTSDREGSEIATDL